MNVLKFGGASIKDASAIRHVAQIIENVADTRPLIVVSASGKTTNALEEVVQAYITGKDAFAALDKVKQKHKQLLDALFEDTSLPIYQELNDLFVDIEWIIEEEVHDPYDYIYDQVVSMGEFLSSKILAAYLQQQGIHAQWLDVRDCIRTDDTYRDAQVDWAHTETRIQQIVPILRERGPVITQGFIGCTYDNVNTTLGREGSDYTAGIFGYCLNAEAVTVWKDVPGLLSGDPRLFEKVALIPQISYQEAIEMAYYGAKVIHPKTLVPLQRKNIPLYVRSFVQPEKDGTRIDNQDSVYPPIVVVKHHQLLLQIRTRDFHFLDEQHLSTIFEALSAHQLNVNLVQHTALHSAFCIDDVEARVTRFVEEMQETYDIELHRELELVTVRHYQDTQFSELKRGREPLAESRIPHTVQMVLPAEHIRKLNW